MPIWIGKEKEYYETIMSKINGVLLPGGNVDKNEKNGYAQAAEHILEIATDLNLNREVFPIFGIGLGMDIMLYYSNNKRDESSDCLLDSLSVSLLFNEATEKTALFNSSSEHMKMLMTTHPIAVLNAKKCYTKDTFERSELARKWIPFSLNSDQRGNVIVSSVEHDILPFYGTLFHSEKHAYEWAENTNIPHTLATIEVAQYFSNYFVNEARKSNHEFDNKQELMGKIIQNYSPEFTAKDGSNYFQAYLFNQKRDENL